MNLYESLRKVKSEEDVKDAYIKALGLKSHTKGLIDIQTNEIWFEAKDTSRFSYYAMFTQLLHYVQAALDSGQPVPPFLAVIDTEKAAIMKSSDVLPFLSKKTVKWGKSASKYTPEALEAISAYIGTYFVAFRMSTDADEFVATVKAAIKSGQIIRTSITPANLKQVFDKWVIKIGREIKGIREEDYALLFFADIMNDGTVATHKDLPANLIHLNGKPAFFMNKEVYELSSTLGYNQFWAIYHRPPLEEYRNYLLERRDSLIPLDERKFKGAFYTPLNVVDKAYDLLQATLGKKWQQEYLVWDMCCGVGNLEVKHSNHRNLFMSTLDDADIKVMQSTKTCAAAHRFQYDYLNDDIEDDGSINYDLSGKVPQALRDAIASKKQILVLINPPYAEAMKADNTAAAGNKASAKTGVSKTRVASCIDKQGYAARELFTQFLVRIGKEMPTATVAIFSKMKYVNAPNFSGFRDGWNAKYLAGFAVHSKAFDGLSGNFPIGFLIWETNQNAVERTPITAVRTEVLDKKATKVGIKTFYNVDSFTLLGDWIKRPRPNNIESIPLSNALTPASGTKDVRGKKWADGAIGGFMCKGSDMQNASRSTAIFSSGYCSAGGFLVTEENLWQVAIIFTIRLLIKKTWLNDRDQLLAPVTEPSDELKGDCLIWMLFSDQNLTASAEDLQWDGRSWQLVNHFIPYSETDVGSPGRFESDFMNRYLSQITLSVEAQAVLAAARPIWASFFEEVDEFGIRNKLHLNRPDVGWYQIRRALKSRGTPTIWSPFTLAYDALSEKLRPQVTDIAMYPDEDTEMIEGPTTALPA
ncbi:hypothetical protein [Pseudomonas sp. URMO17WK12:I4]|uniref:hypothetical protein n=1 Tax=Pseudomonas sp. URMO17WK12:I4 TaxID=1283292 RepID=UPI0004B85B7D|nr:hypothetical protein [Pseudomonas sp. URMO17WK12:I4]